jgi:hypothetical protein
MDVLEAYRRFGDYFCSVVRSVPTDAWSSPTPCTDWGAKQFTNHVVYEDWWTPPMMAGKTIADRGDTPIYVATAAGVDCLTDDRLEYILATNQQNSLRGSALAMGLTPNTGVCWPQCVMKMHHNAT